VDSLRGRHQRSGRAQDRRPGGPGGREPHGGRGLRLPGGSMKGFTLVEMLVALLIFSGIAAAGVAAMSLAADNRLVVRQRMDRLASFQRTRALLKADLEQAADRPT